MSRVWHQLAGPPRPESKAPLLIESGEGAWITDSEGRSYLDGLSGQWCVNLGYGREELVQAAAGQLRRLAFQPLTKAHPPAVALASTSHSAATVRIVVMPQCRHRRPVA